MYQVIIKTATEQPICHGIYSKHMSSRVRNVVSTTLAMLWTAVAQAPLFAGDTPMSTPVVPAMSSPKDPSDPDAADQKPQDRRDLIRKLSILVSGQTGEDPVRDAILLLRRQETNEAIDLLVQNIGFPETAPDGARRRMRMGTSQLGPVKDRLPGIAALLEIGPACADRVITKLLTTDNVVQFKACVAVLQGLDHQPSVREKLKRAMSDTPRELRARVERAMETRETTEEYWKRVMNAARTLWSSTEGDPRSRAGAKKGP